MKCKIKSLTSCFPQVKLFFSLACEILKATGIKKCHCFRTFYFTVDVAQSKLSANNVFTIAKRTVEGQVSSITSLLLLLRQMLSQRDTSTVRKVTEIWLKKCQNSAADFSGQRTDERIAFFKKVELPFNDITFIIPAQLLISGIFWRCVRRL